MATAEPTREQSRDAADHAAARIAEKDLQDRREAAAKAEKLAHDKEVKREAEERANTKKYLSEILLLRGLARAVSPHGSEDFAGALDAIANALAAGREVDEKTMVEIAIALKNPKGYWGGMVKTINELMKPEVLQDRTVIGILNGVKSGDVTADQAQELLNKVQDKAKG